MPTPGHVFKCLLHVRDDFPTECRLRARETHVQLARALRKEWGESSSDPGAFEALCFSLAELRLTVAHAFTSLAPKYQLAFAALFGEALGAIGETALTGEMASSLREYMDAVAAECRRLVPVEATP